jgi:CheY-like chemotaxis protein
MRISSKVGTGTTIELWLPVSEREMVEEVRPAGPTRIDDMRACRVLVVDDDPIVMSGTAAMLEDLGHCAIEVASAELALQVLGAQDDIDVVITDHAMPGMTGTELAERIRRHWPGLPVVLVSGYTELPSEELGFPRLSKPYRQEELARLLVSLVGIEPTALRGGSPSIPPDDAIYRQTVPLR